MVPCSKFQGTFSAEASLAAHGLVGQRTPRKAGRKRMCPGSASQAKMTFGIFLAFNGMSGLMLGATFNELHRWDRRPVFPPNFSVCRFGMISVSYEQQKCIRLISRILGHLYCQISTGQGPKTVPLEEQHGRRGLQKSRCGLEQTHQSAPSWNQSSIQGIPPWGWHSAPHRRGLLVLMFVRFSAKQSQAGQELMVQT